MKINRGIIALLVSILIWGSTLVISKAALEGMGAMMLTFGRFLIAYLLLYPLAARRGYRIQHSFQKPYLLLGLTGVALHYALQNIALLYTSAMSAALISAGGTFLITRPRSCSSKSGLPHGSWWEFSSLWQVWC